MCLAVPMKLEDVKGVWARAVCGDTAIKVNLSLLDEPREGEYVLVHAGFAIQRMDEEEAMKTYELLRELEKGA